MVFKPKETDYQLSPYTGLTRDSWIAAGEYLLTGMFRHIPSVDAPVVVPRTEYEITYPHENGKVSGLEKEAEYFEGLARSLLLAAPVIHNHPDLVINGICLRDYYKNQILRACTEGDANFVGSYRQLQEMAKGKPRHFQQTVETAALVICLDHCRKEIWDTYEEAEKDLIADFLSGYAHGNTAPQNWRLFNMLDLAFLHMEGYPIDRDIMRDHAQTILHFYAGDGWYRDGHAFDYYSCWAFQMYAPIWNNWYGYEHEPYLAKRFAENSNLLMKTYADFFDRDGFTMMWGRSNIYRNAATCAFDGNMLLENPAVDPGRARRIASGSLLQFLSREDFLVDGVPSMGFYGMFAPLIQPYSCAESPYWFGKSFMNLFLPADHPYWTATEHNGTWEQLGKTDIKETVLAAPALCFTNHGANGETILRTAKVVKDVGDEHGMWNYSKLSYNSKYPWESGKSVETQQYVLNDMTVGDYKKANVTFWHGWKNGVLYRRQFFNYNLATEMSSLQGVNLADFPVPYGLIRVDKLRLFQRPIEITLGAYGFPDNGTAVSCLEEAGAKAILLKGRDFCGREKQMAMTLYDGWDSIQILHSEGTNPDSPKSIVIYGKLERKKQYGYDPYVMVSQVITKESHDDFTKAEIFPIESVQYTDSQCCGGYGPVTVTLKTGAQKVIEFEGMEGNLQL